MKREVGFLFVLFVFLYGPWQESCRQKHSHHSVEEIKSALLFYFLTKKTTTGSVLITLLKLYKFFVNEIPSKMPFVQIKRVHFAAFHKTRVRFIDYGFMLYAKSFNLMDKNLNISFFFRQNQTICFYWIHAYTPYSESLFYSF